MSPQNLTIAVLITPPIQLLDLSPIDLFHMLSKEYLRSCQLPTPLIALGLDTVTIHYIGEAGPSDNPPPVPVPVPASASASASKLPRSNGNNNNNNNLIDNDKDKTATAAAVVVAEMTSSAAIRLTHNLSSSTVQPGAIDILLIPGPDPSLTPSTAVHEFIRAHHMTATTTIMSVCTGIFTLAYAGILDGRVCTGPRGLLGLRLEKEFPGAKWVEKRWAVDLGNQDKGQQGVTRGELWTAGGITNGMDMVAAYLRGKYRRELADLVCGLADVEGREVDYGVGRAREGGWWVWLIFRAWFWGLVGGKEKGKE